MKKNFLPIFILILFVVLLYALSLFLKIKEAILLFKILFYFILSLYLVIFIHEITHYIFFKCNHQKFRMFSCGIFNFIRLNGHLIFRVKPILGLFDGAVLFDSPLITSKELFTKYILKIKINYIITNSLTLLLGLLGLMSFIYIKNLFSLMFFISSSVLFINSLIISNGDLKKILSIKFSFDNSYFFMFGLEILTLYSNKFICDETERKIKDSKIDFDNIYYLKALDDYLIMCLYKNKINNEIYLRLKDFFKTSYFNKGKHKTILLLSVIQKLALVEFLFCRDYTLLLYRIDFLSKIIKENNIIRITGHIESINNLINDLNTNKINDAELIFCQEHLIYKNFSEYNDVINKIKSNLIKSDCTINLG